MTAGSQKLVLMTARLYAVLALLFGLFDLAFGVFMLTTGSHAALAGIVYVVPGFILAALAAVLWLGAYWAALLALATSLIPGVFPFLWYDLAAGRMPITAWWNILGLAAPAIFLILTALLLVCLLRARTTIGRTHLSGPTASKALAAVVLTYGFCLVLLGALELIARGRAGASVPFGYFLALPGASLLTFAVFIWRDWIWAMIAAFAASLVPWVYPLLWTEVDRGAVILDWFGVTLLVVPTLFGVLVAYAVLSTIARARRNATDPAT